MNNVFVRLYKADELPIDKKEILRYAGAVECDDLSGVLNDCLCEALSRLSYRICYREFSVKIFDDKIDLGFTRIRSKNLQKNLQGCEKIILFSATVGIEIDRFIRKYGRISPTKALFFQAIGSERVETLADKFNEEIREEARAKGFTTHPRYSPGYGDLALDIQKEIFEVLDCTKQIGITLSESLLMSPSKSITAIIGLKKITSE